jgi:hypothetical protein
MVDNDVWGAAAQYERLIAGILLLQTGTLR